AADRAFRLMFAGSAVICGALVEPTPDTGPCPVRPFQDHSFGRYSEMTDQTGGAEEVAQASADASEQPVQQSTVLEREHTETKDRLLRALAEMENLRKRNGREGADSGLRNVTSFACELLLRAE